MVLPDDSLELFFGPLSRPLFRGIGRGLVAGIRSSAGTPIEPREGDRGHGMVLPTESGSASK